MGKGNNAKVLTIVLMIVMVLSAFGGLSGLAMGPENLTAELKPVTSDITEVTFKELDARQPVNENLLNKKIISGDNSGILPLSQPPGNEIKSTWTYDFDSDTVGQLPSDPPWQHVNEPAGQLSTFGPDDFENDIVGEKPDDPPWTTVDGSGRAYYWLEDFEGFTLGQDLTGGQISGSLGYFGMFDPAASLTAEAPPAGAPGGTVLPGVDTGTLAAYFVDAGAGSYWGPAGIGGPTTDQGYCGGWVYMTAVARFDLGIIDMGLMAVTAEVAFQNDNNIYHWPGGIYTPIPGLTWALNTWHELFIQYDDPTHTYSVWFDGVQHASGSAFVNAAGTDTDGIVWFGDGTTDCFVDNFCHMWPGTGLTDVCQVVNTEAHSGAQSVFLDQNNETAPEMVRMVADFDPPMAGTGTWDYWFRTDSVIADTNGAIAAILDQSGSPVIEIRANVGNFEYNDGGVWQVAQAFAADTWYQFTINFNTVFKMYDLLIDTVPVASGAFARESGTLTGVRYAGTSGTESEHYIDDVNVTCTGAGTNIRVSNLVSHSAPNSLRFQEYNSGGSGFIGADQLGAGIGAIGNFSFWFYSTENWGGQTWTLADMNGGATMTVFSMGVNLATLEGIPGETHFVDYDGTGNWIINGPTYNANEWHQIGIDYDCLNTSHSGSTGTFFYTWDGGPQQGPYGMIGAAGYLDFLVCDGGATDTYGDFFYDDFSLSLYAVPGPPTADAGPDQTVPQHTLLLFDGSASTDDDGITNYWWNFTDGVPKTLTGVAPTYTFDNESVYIVTLTVRDTMGQEDQDTMIVSVTDGDPPVADAGQDQEVLPSDMVFFDGSGSYDPGHLGEPIINGIANWTWTFDDGTGPQTLYDPNPIHQFDIPGSFLVTLTVSDAAPAPGPWTDTDTMYVNISEYFNIDITESMLSGGWILISFPNKVEGHPFTIIVDQVDEIGSGIGYVQWDIVQWYDPLSAPRTEWKTTSTFKPPSLNTFNYVNNTMGFWIHITDFGDGNLSIAGPIATSGEWVGIPTYIGWNLIGWPSPGGSMLMDDLLIGSNCDIVCVYDSSAPYGIREAITSIEFFEPGHGYWLRNIIADEVILIWIP